MTIEIIARLEHETLLPERELSALIAQSYGSGAVVNFTGLARPLGIEGDSVSQLVLDHHPTLTIASLEDIAQACARSFAVTAVRVVHRCGAVAAGEPIVFAGAAAPHRRAAFDAADYLMDRLKTEAVFWKKELGPQGSRWIEPTADDYAQRERWS